MAAGKNLVPGSAQMLLLRLLAERLPVGKKDFTAAHYRALSDLLEGGGMLTLPAGACAVCRGQTLTLLPPGPPLAPVVLHPGKNFWGEYTISVRKTAGNFSRRSDTIVLNCDKIDGALSVGPYTGGQRLTLPGSRGAASSACWRTGESLRSCGSASRCCASGTGPPPCGAWARTWNFCRRSPAKIWRSP